MMIFRRVALAAIAGSMLASTAFAQTVVHDGPAVQQSISASALPVAGQVRVNPNPPQDMTPAAVVRGQTVVNDIQAPTPVLDSAERGRILSGPQAGRAPAQSPVIEGVNTPFSIGILSQTDTSRPFSANNYSADGQFTIEVSNGNCTTATYTVNASPIAGTDPVGGTPPFTNVVTYIGFPQGNFLFNNAGAGSYLVTVTESSGSCSFDPSDNPQTLEVVIATAPLDGPIGLSIENQTATTRPIAASNYAADASFRMRTTDPATCTGTYTVNATPVVGSGPDGSTPPGTTVITYIGFPQGTVYFFDNAGAGQYTVTATETGAQCVQAPGDEQQVLTVTIEQGPFDTPYIQSVASQVNTSLPFNDPSYTPNGAFTMNIADGSCAGTYTVNSSPVAGSAPDGSTPPTTTVVTYIGFPQGNFLFDNAGIGDYLVTINETGNCTFEPGNDPSTRVVTVAGNQPVLDITPASVDFGDVEVDTASAAQNVTLGNSGTANLLITSLDAAVAPFALDGGSCGAVPISIPIGGNCTLSYSFNPTATGPAAQTVALTSTATPTAASFDLAGNGVEAVATLDLSLLTLGPITVGQGDTGVITVTSDGNVDLVISEITDPGAPFSINGGSCLPVPTTLAPGESCTIEVLFLPGTADGTFTSSFDIVSNAASSPDTVDLQGTSLPLVPVPALDRLGLLALAMLLLLVAGISLRKRIV